MILNEENEKYLSPEELDEIHAQITKESGKEKEVTAAEPVEASHLSTLIPAECMEVFFEGLSKVIPVSVETDVENDVKNLPESVDLRKWSTVVDNQGPDGLCHHADTEVLTAEGWLHFYELSGEEKLASVNPLTQELIFEKPTRLIGYEYKGPMVYGKHKFLDFAVTPDHEMLVRPWDSKNKKISDEYVFTPAKELGWYSGLMSRVNYEGGDDSDTYSLPAVDHETWNDFEAGKERTVPMNAWLNFLGLYLADGTLIQSKGHYKIQLAGKKEHKRELFQFLAKELKLNLCELDDRVTFENKQIWKALEGYGLVGMKAPQKFVPEFVFSLSKRNIEHFLDGHFMGDGGFTEDRKSHWTSSHRLAEDLQRLIFLTGEASQISTRAPRESMLNGRPIKGNHFEHKVSVCEKMNLAIDRNEHIRIEQYEGMVFCAEVPTYHTLVTRRNGKILIAGNCTAYATIAYLGFKIAKETGKKYDLSEHYHWKNYAQYNSMAASNALIKFWQGPEKLWPDYATQGLQGWDESRFATLKAPRELHSIQEMKAHLAAGEPVVLSIGLDTAYWNQPIIYGDRGTQKSGHAVLAVGYGKANFGEYVIIQNSWGTGNGGDKGFWYIQMSYLWGSRFWTNAIVFDKEVVYRDGKKPDGGGGGGQNNITNLDLKAVVFKKYNYKPDENSAEHGAYGVTLDGKDIMKVKSVSFDLNPVLPKWVPEWELKETFGTYAAPEWPAGEANVTLNDGRSLKLPLKIPKN